MKADIVIIGGGIVGSSVAYHLAAKGNCGDVYVIETDPTYSWAATARSMGGVRQLFSLPDNIAMSQYGLAFYKMFDDAMAVGGEKAAVGWRNGGYLFLADKSDAAQMEANYRTQTDHGVRADLLNAGEVANRFPSLRVDDIVIGVHSPDDGWVDPYGALQGFRKKALELGVHYIQSRVVDFEVENRLVSGVRLHHGETVHASAFVNAAGAWSGDVAKAAGMTLPVVPMSRLCHFFRCQTDIEPLPLVKQPNDCDFRPEGDGFVGGVTDWSVKPGFNFEEDQSDHFDKVVWPALAERCRTFEAVKLEREWRGHYALNTLDQNMILGPWVGGAENLFTVTGFSGHGVMHAPAAGRGMAELLLYGRFETLDLSRFSYQRVLDNEPYAEAGII